MSQTNLIASHLLRSRIGKLCVAVTGASADEMIAKANDVLKETSFLEFRLDYLPKPLEALPALKAFVAENGAATVIATCRCKAYGGKFAGSNTAAADVLQKAAEAGFQLVDVELESAEKLARGTLERMREAGAALIISHHDFEGTRDLDAVLARISPLGPDFIKIVPTAKTLSDNLELMRFLERAEDSHPGQVVGICMGEPGIISRVLGLRAGSAFTFAAATAGEETAPGQIAARTLLETYRIDQVDAATKVYGVAGDPIRSSLSPVMMNTAFRRETVNAVYLALQANDVHDLFRLVREIPFQGVSVTMPLKQDIMPLLERTDPLSTKIGAVNTILRAQDGKFYGFNTDVQGIVAPLERRLTLKGAKVLVLGAGGAARAAVFGLRDKGAEVSILNRTPEAAQKLAKQAGAKCIKREAVAKAGFDVIINATPIGMAGVKAEPLLGAEDLQCKLVFDLVYNPIETPLLRMARQRGIAVITGVEMFVQQGARQFEIWTGKPAPEEEMLRVVVHQLRQAAIESGAAGAGEAGILPGQATRIATAAGAAATAATAAAEAATAAAELKAAGPAGGEKKVASAPDGGGKTAAGKEPAAKASATAVKTAAAAKDAAKAPVKGTGAKAVGPVGKAGPAGKVAPAEKPAAAGKSAGAKAALTPKAAHATAVKTVAKAVGAKDPAKAAGKVAAKAPGKAPAKAANKSAAKKGSR